jgi:cob(I)alamin adenosyltransferase
MGRRFYLACSKFADLHCHVKPLVFRLTFTLKAQNMGNRLSKIATRTGDAGTTGLGDGSRIDKDGLRVHAMGDVDELNSHIGLLLCEDMPAALREELISIQHDLFDLGGELCIPGYQMITEAQVMRLDALLEKYNADLPPLKDFILPAGSRGASQAHVCRTVCRRAERAIVSLGKAEAIFAFPRQYVNRLSDLLFVLSRVLNRFAGGSDVLWEKERNRDIGAS